MANSVPDWESRIGRRLKLRDLHILSAVVRFGSMAKAATHLGMSQPAVSEAIAALEDTLRVRLLDRSPRGVEPTIYAGVLLKRGDVVFDELKQGMRDIAFLTDPTAGEIRIGCPESLMAGFVPAVIERISQRHPKISVHVVAAQPGEQEFQELRARSVDLLLGRVFRPLSDDDVVHEILCQDVFRVVVGSQSPWARRRDVALADLMEEPWILFPDNSVVSSYLEEAFRTKGLTLPRASVATFSTQIRRHLLESGRFVSILHESVLRFSTRRWPLKVLPIDLFVRPMPIAIFRLKNRTLSPVVQLFAEHAREVAESAGGRADRPRGSRTPAS